MPYGFTDATLAAITLPTCSMTLLIVGLYHKALQMPFKMDKSPGKDYVYSLLSLSIYNLDTASIKTRNDAPLEESH